MGGSNIVRTSRMRGGQQSSTSLAMDFGIALVGFVLLMARRAPPLLVVVISAFSGMTLATFG